MDARSHFRRTLKRAEGRALLNGRVGCQFNDTWSLALEVFNILDAEVSDIDYFYPSRLAGDPLTARTVFTFSCPNCRPFAQTDGSVPAAALRSAMDTPARIAR